MNKRIFAIAAATAVVLPVTVAVAQTDDVIKSTSSVSKGGTKKKPKAVALSYDIDVSGPPGRRANTALVFDNTWAGLKTNGKYFPTCTAAQIDAVQSNSVCPPGAVIGTGRLEALIGPANDQTNPGALCKKDITLYNEGQGKVNTYGSGNPADCLGIGYTYPTQGTFKVKNGKLVYHLPIPENIREPLPGVSGYFSHIEVKFLKKTVTVKGKKHGFFESVGCGKKKKRAYSFTSTSEQGKTTVKSSAGKC